MKEKWIKCPLCGGKTVNAKTGKCASDRCIGRPSMLPIIKELERIEKKNP